MHIDIDYAKAAGEFDVFAHGMLVMAYLGRSVTSWVPQSALRSFNTRFTAITRVGEKIIVTGKVTEKMQAGGEKLVRVELAAANDKGEAKARRRGGRGSRLIESPSAVCAGRLAHFRLPCDSTGRHCRLCRRADRWRVTPLEIPRG